MSARKDKNCQISVISDGQDVSPSRVAAKPSYKLYKERWWVLTVVILLQLSHALVWESFTPIPNMAASFMRTSLANVNWITTTAYLVFPVLSLPSMWINNKFGLRYVIYLAGLTNALGSLIKLFASMTFVPPIFRFPVTIMGQTIEAIALPFLMFTPTAVSQLWFPEHQRIHATTASITSYNVGTALASLASPYIVKAPISIRQLNYYFCSLTVIIGFLSFTVRHSKPPTPPSASASSCCEDEDSTSHFFQDLNTIIRNKNLMILIICGGGITFGIRSALYAMAQEFTCLYGYSNTFIGTAEFFFIVGGTVSSTLLGILAEKKVWYEEVVKISCGVGAVLLVAFFIVCQLPNYDILLQAIFILTGCASFAVWPIVSELAVETAYPLNEGVIGNFVALSGSIQTAILVPVMTCLTSPLNYVESRVQTCSVGRLTYVYDLTNAGLFMMGVYTLESIILIAFCRPKYLRKKAELLKAQLPTTLTKL